MTATLSEAIGAECGGKAMALSRLLRAGIKVPDGFVVPADAGQADDPEAGPNLRGRVDRELSRLGHPVVAVRSSAADEDMADASAAGMYESILGVRGTPDVIEAITACRRSANAARIRNYRCRGGRTSESATVMAVLVQVLIAAEVSGVMFTPRVVGAPTRIEASWGLGLSVVGGALTPDAFEVGPSGSITAVIGSKGTRIDADIRTDSDSQHHGAKPTAVANGMRTMQTLDDETLLDLAALGAQVSAVLGGAQDIEWAIADGTIWIVQSRPVTASLPAMLDPSTGSGTRAGARTRAGRPAGNQPSIRADAAESRHTLVGTPGSHGVVTARARIVPGPSAFTDVKPGELVICPYTNPAWTPLFSIASGVLTEAGGALSHAAIVAREYGIPAVLGVAEASATIANGDLITIDGTAGTVTMHPSRNS